MTLTKDEKEKLIAAGFLNTEYDGVGGFLTKKVPLSFIVPRTEILLGYGQYDFESEEEATVEIVPAHENKKMGTGNSDTLQIAYPVSFSMDFEVGIDPRSEKGKKILYLCGANILTEKEKVSYARKHNAVVEKAKDGRFFYRFKQLGSSRSVFDKGDFETKAEAWEACVCWIEQNSKLIFI